MSLPEAKPDLVGQLHPDWGPPYLLYLGDAPDILSIKTARGLAYWRPELCVAQVVGPNCKARLDLPTMSFVEARAARLPRCAAGR